MRQPSAIDENGPTYERSMCAPVPMTTGPRKRGPRKSKMPWSASTWVDARWFWESLLWISVALALISFGQYVWRARQSAGQAAPDAV